MHVWKNLIHQKNSFDLIYNPWKFQVDISCQYDSMQVLKNPIFSSQGRAILVLGLCRGGGTPQTPHHIIKIVPLGVYDSQQEYHGILEIPWKWLGPLRAAVPLKGESNFVVQNFGGRNKWKCRMLPVLVSSKSPKTTEVAIGYWDFTQTHTPSQSPPPNPQKRSRVKI